MRISLKRRQAEGGAQLRFNCELRNEKYEANVDGKLNGKVTNLVVEVHVPIMRNSVDLRPQETLLLEVGRKIAKRPAPETWAHSAKKRRQKQEDTERHQGAAQSHRRNLMGRRAAVAAMCVQGASKTIIDYRPLLR